MLTTKKKKLFIYTPTEYGPDDKPSLQDLGNGHMVYGSDKELEAYRAKRFN